MERLVEILRKAVSDGASDIFIVAGGALSYKVDGEIRPMEASAERLMPDDTKVLLDEIYECASREKTHFLEEGVSSFAIIFIYIKFCPIFPLPLRTWRDFVSIHISNVAHRRRLSVLFRSGFRITRTWEFRKR